VELAKCNFRVITNDPVLSRIHGNLPERTLFCPETGESISYDIYLNAGKAKRFFVFVFTAKPQQRLLAKRIILAPLL
jgi:hypothetical protein